MFSGVKHSNTPRFHPACAFCAACVRCNGRSRPACFAGGSRVVLPALHAGRLHQMRPSLGGELRFLPYPSHFDDGSVHPPRPFVKQKVRTVCARKSQAKNAVLFQQTILRYFVHFWQHEKATRQSPAGSLCFIVLFPCYFRVLCVRFSLKYERAGAARPPPPSTRPAPCSHSARLKPFAGSCSSRFGFA